MHHAGGGESSRLELLGELHDDVPPPSGNGALDGPREGVFNGQRRSIWLRRRVPSGPVIKRFELGRCGQIIHETLARSNHVDGGDLADS